CLVRRVHLETPDVGDRVSVLPVARDGFGSRVHDVVVHDLNQVRKANAFGYVSERPGDDLFGVDPIAGPTKGGPVGRDQPAVEDLREACVSQPADDGEMSHRNPNYEV